ncbi:uncharacterized protein LOC144446306 [Glandiceps talaboti]
MSQETFSAEQGQKQTRCFHEEDTVGGSDDHINTLPVILSVESGDIGDQQSHSDDTLKALSDITESIPRQESCIAMPSSIHLTVPADSTTTSSPHRATMDLSNDLTLNQATAINQNIPDAQTTSSLIKIPGTIAESHHDFQTQSQTMSIIAVNQADISQSHVTLTTINQSDIGEDNTLAEVSQSQLFHNTDGQSMIEAAQAIGQISTQQLLTDTNSSILTVNAENVTNATSAIQSHSTVAEALSNSDCIAMSENPVPEGQDSVGVPTLLVQDPNVSSHTMANPNGDNTEESDCEGDGNQAAKRPKRIFMCQVCQKNFTSQASLKSHLMIHMGARPFKCDLCSATFNRMGNYTRHRLIHTVNTNDDHRYKCEYCSRTFLQKCDLKRHQHIHDGTQPYRCNMCERGFIRKSDLTVHMRFHTKEKPFPCTQCERAFSQSGDLNRHIRSVHTHSESLKCGHCKKKYTKESTLIRHMQTAHQDILQTVALKLQKQSSQTISTVNTDATSGISTQAHNQGESSTLNVIAPVNLSKPENFDLKLETANKS